MPTVLVVDDEPQIVELLRAYLERDGFEAICAPRSDHRLIHPSHAGGEAQGLSILNAHLNTRYQDPTEQRRVRPLKCPYCLEGIKDEAIVYDY